MPSGVTNFGAAAWVQALFGVTPAIGTYYVALLSDEPGEDMDGDAISDLEPDDTAYGRQAYATGAANWAANSNFITTINDVEYGLPTVDWGDITHFALCTASTSGDVYAWGEFLNGQYVSANNELVVPAGSLVISLNALDYSIAV